MFHFKYYNLKLCLILFYLDLDLAYKKTLARFWLEFSSLFGTKDVKRIFDAKSFFGYQKAMFVSNEKSQLNTINDLCSIGRSLKVKNVNMVQDLALMIFTSSEIKYCTHGNLNTLFRNT